MIRFHFYNEFWFRWRFYLLSMMIFFSSVAPYAKWDVFNVIYFTVLGIFLLLQIFVPECSHKRSYPVGSYHFNWEFYYDISLYMMFYFLRTFSSGPISGDTVWYWILLIADILVICTFVIKREKAEKSVE